MSQWSLHNYILETLSPDDFDILTPHLERVDLPRGAVLVIPNQLIAHVYFLETGVGSIVALSPEGNRVEAGLFGLDAATPTAVLLGSDRTPLEHVMQVAGSGHRIAVDDLLGAAVTSPSLMALLLRYAHALSVQIAFTALSNAIHTIDVRLARWLLMLHDRHNSDEIKVTHDFISLMLAVRRPSVTMAFHVLEGNQLIRSDRNLVTIRDRKKLESYASDAYGKPEAENGRLIGLIRHPDNMH